jgi:arsenate reductase
MKEVGISLEANFPKSVDRFLDTEWDYVITVCDNAKESCPLYTGKVKHRIHIGFEDPADATGNPEEILNEYRRIRDEIKEGFSSFYSNNLKH